MATKGPGRGRLPDVDKLINKTPEQLVKTLNRFGINPDLDGIASRGKRAFASIERMLDEGIMPDEAMWERLASQHVREMTQNLRKMVKSSIRNYRQDKLGKKGKFIWITSGGANVCPSCEPRHGKIKTMAQWQALGLPGSQALVCNDECQCQLLPAP